MTTTAKTTITLLSPHVIIRTTRTKSTTLRAKIELITTGKNDNKINNSTNKYGKYKNRKKQLK